MAANARTPIDKEQLIEVVKLEMEHRVEMFNKLAMTCFRKCVDQRYREPELNMGENSCIDRCVTKYIQVNGIIGQMLANQRP